MSIKQALGGLARRIFSVSHMIRPDQVIGELPSSRTIYQNTLRISWPAALESVLIALIGAIDTMMVGSLGTAAIAAVGITGQPKFLVLAAIFSLNVGVTAVVARRKGEDDIEGANRCMRQTILISGAISLTLTVLVYIFTEPLLIFAGAEEDYLGLAVSYFRIILIGTFFSAMTMTINAAQRGVGNTRISLKTNTAANLVNVTFNFFLINGIWIFPRLEVRGAAIATVLGNFVAFVMASKSILDGRSVLVLIRRQRWWPDRETMKSIWTVSSSALVEQVFMRIGFFAYNKLVAGLGTTALATHQICMNIISLSFSFGDGLGAASSSLIGQNLGAKRPDLAIIYGKSSQRIALCIATVLCAFFLATRRGLMLLFSREEEVILLGMQLIIIIAVSCYFQLPQVVVSGSLRGAGDTRFVAMVSLISIGIIRPIVTWLLCYRLGFGLVGAWISLLFDQIIRYAANYIRFGTAKWTKIKL